MSHSVGGCLILDKKYKSLRTGNTKTYIPKFQPVRPKKDLNKDNKKNQEENINIEENDK